MLTMSSGLYSENSRTTISLMARAAWNWTMGVCVLSDVSSVDGDSGGTGGRCERRQGVIWNAQRETRHLNAGRVRTCLHATLKGQGFRVISRRLTENILARRQ